MGLCLGLLVTGHGQGSVLDYRMSADRIKGPPLRLSPPGQDLATAVLSKYENVNVVSADRGGTFFMLHPSYQQWQRPLTVFTSHSAVFRAHQVINNAGIVSRGEFVDTPVSEARKLLEVNYLGTYMVTQVSIGTGLMQ